MKNNPELQKKADKIKNDINSRFWTLKSQHDGSWLSMYKVLESLKKPFDSFAIATKCAETTDPKNKYFGMKVEEIMNQWTTKNIVAKEKGSNLDEYIQALRKNQFITPVEPGSSIDLKRKQYDRFDSEVLDQTELQSIGQEIWVNYQGIRGKMDELMLAPTERIFLFDWKQNELLKRYNTFENLVGPVKNYPNSDLHLDTIQLYLYKYCLGKINIPVAAERIVWFTETNYEIIKPAFEYSESLIEDCIDHAKNYATGRIS